MPLRIAYVLTLALLASLGLPAQTAQSRKSSPSSARKSTSAKKTTTAQKSTAKKSASTRKSPSKSASKTTTRRSRYSSSRRRPPRVSTQQEPTPERYREIQQALADRGYFSGQPTGKWDDASVEAMRRFQEDQKLDSSGKIDALSLIALGLGPKRVTQNQARSPNDDRSPEGSQRP